MSRILVTGGAGFLGSHLCTRLIQENHGNRKRLDLVVKVRLQEEEESIIIIHVVIFADDHLWKQDDR